MPPIFETIQSFPDSFFFFFFPTGATGEIYFPFKVASKQVQLSGKHRVSSRGDFFFETEGGKDAGLEKRLISKMAEYELANLLPAVVVVSVLLLFLLSLLLAVAFTIVVIVDSVSLLSLFLLQFLTLYFYLKH